MKLIHCKKIERKLRQAARQMPQPQKPLPLSPVMEERCQSEREHSAREPGSSVWRTPGWRIAVIVLLVFAIGGTTTLAANPDLRIALARVFSFGTTELVPSGDLEEEDFGTVSDYSEVADDTSGELSGNVTRQTAGNLTLVQDVTLDSHFTASYVSCPDFVDIVETPSGAQLFWTHAADGNTAYYGITDGKLEEIRLEMHTMTASVQPGMLPGIMAAHGDTDVYRNLKLPRMEFTVRWQQYGSDILIDDTETGGRFDIGSTYGGELENDYDGQFFYHALPGNDEVIEVYLMVAAQLTSYQYPFLLNLKTGEVSDPLAAVDLSGWECITDLSIGDDLKTATALAGSNHEDLRKITIDLKSGTVTAASAIEPPVDDVITWFRVNDETLFYVTGTDESGDGYLYNTQTGESVHVFTDTAAYSMQDATRFWKSLGYGYLAYYDEDTVSLIDLEDGGEMTVLEGISTDQESDFFINYEGSVLSISMYTYDEDTFHTDRLCLMDLKTNEIWYFDREMPDHVDETSYCWNGEYEYVINAQNTETGTYYVYMYQYTP